ncbi:MAG: flippase-like domain-containing protein [Gemmatimonadetes bacterium]|nr:flippase-like domain-containing protein [Gemmatimonadota bacterium]
MRVNGKAVVGIVLSLLLLWWTLRDVSLAHIVHELRNADPFLFLLAVTVATLGLVTRAIRWRILLLPVTRDLPFRPRFAATAIGFAANNLLPARVGEFARAFSLSRFSRVSTAAAFGSLVIERVLDALVIVALLFGVMVLPGFPPIAQIGGVDLRAAAVFVVAAIGGLSLVLFFLVAAPVRAASAIEWVAVRTLPPSIRRTVVDALHAFLHGLAALRSPRLLLLSLGWAVGQWLFLGLSFLLAFRAFDIREVGFAGALFLQSLIGLAVAIPSSPGFFGPFEAAAKVGLSLWGVAPEKAVSFAVGFHIGGFIPVTLIGVYYVWKMDLRWQDVGRSEEVVEERVERDQAALAMPVRERTRHD